VLLHLHHTKHLRVQVSLLLDQCVTSGLLSSVYRSPQAAAAVAMPAHLLSLHTAPLQLQRMLSDIEVSQALPNGKQMRTVQARAPTQ
jgi:hypothetical protein